MNTQILLPYGKQHIAVEILQEELSAVIKTGLSSCVPEKPQDEIVKSALRHPYDSPGLETLARGGGYGCDYYFGPYTSYAQQNYDAASA